MMYRIDIGYDGNRKNSCKVLLDDGTRQKIVILDIYAIRGRWYLDIRDTEKPLHIGQRINSYEDLFDICRRRYRDFPDVKMSAIPINHNGFDVKFDTETAGVLQDLVVIADE